MIEERIKDLIDLLKTDGNNVLGYVYNDDAKFIPGTTPVYYSGPYWDNKEIIAAVKALLTGKWLSSGEKVKEFEDKFSEKFGGGYSVMVNSGSSANLVMLAALKKYYGWADGAEVIVSCVGFPTTIAPIVQNNLKPVFVDIELDTLNADYLEIYNSINANTVAILISPVLGNPPDMGKLLNLHSILDLELILDNCDSLGTTWDYTLLNQLVVASSCSFYPAHHISSLDYNEKIFIINKTTTIPKIESIGKFVEEYPDKTNWSCFGFDSAGRIDVRNITNIVKHPVNESLIKVTLQTGRTAIVSTSHSVFGISNEKITPLTVSELSVGDLVLAPNRLPNLQTIDTISITKYKKGSWIPYNDSVILDKNFGNFLGWFTAEGFFNKTKSGNYSLSFCMNSKEIEYAKELQQYLLDTFLITSKIYYKGNAIYLYFSNKGLYNFLELWVGKGAKNKKVPDFIFASPSECKESFLTSYFLGDGCSHPTFGVHRGFSMDSVTVSKELAEGIFYLLLQLGIPSRFSLKSNESSHTFKCTSSIPRGYTSNCLPAYSVCFSDKSIFTAKSFRGGNKQRIYGDLSLVKITKIEQIESTTPYVYDLSVDGFENFIGGIGMALHNTGEGGMISSKNESIIKLARSIAWWGRDCECTGVQNLLSNGVCHKRFACWLDNYDGIIDHKYLFTNMGYNLKPLDFQGAMGLEQLKKFDEIHYRRVQNEHIITETFLKYLPELKTPTVLSGAKPSWFGTPFICPNKEYKNKLVAFLESKKIQTRNYFAGNILLHPGYKHLGNYRDYPNANKILDTVFFIGCAPHYGENILGYIEDCVKEFYIN